MPLPRDVSNPLVLAKTLKHLASFASVPHTTFEEQNARHLEPEATAARHHHAAVSVGDEWVLLHGGDVFDLPPSQSITGEIFLLHTPTLRWFQPPALWLDATGGSGTFVGERRRHGHTAVRLASGEIVLFGGLEWVGRASVTSVETWLLEL